MGCKKLMIRNFKLKFRSSTGQILIKFKKKIYKAKRNSTPNEYSPFSKIYVNRDNRDNREKSRHLYSLGEYICVMLIT